MSHSEHSAAAEETAELLHTDALHKQRLSTVLLSTLFLFSFSQNDRKKFFLL